MRQRPKLRLALAIGALVGGVVWLRGQFGILWLISAVAESLPLCALLFALSVVGAGWLFTRMRRPGLGIAVSVLALFAGVSLIQNWLYERREQMLAHLQGATKAEVRTLFGPPNPKDSSEDSWRYDPTLPWVLSLFRGDDMLISFEDGKVDFCYVMPE